MLEKKEATYTSAASDIQVRAYMMIFLFHAALPLWLATGGDLLHWNFD